MKITHSGGTWQCAEIGSERTFGYGKYIFYLDSPPDFDPNVVKFWLLPEVRALIRDGLVRYLPRS